METSEELQVSNYGIGGHYEPHFDFARREETNAFASLGTGNRIATLLMYASDLAAFVGFLDRRGVGSLNAATRKQILDFLLEAREQGLRTTTLSRRLVAIKVFFRYLQQEGLMAGNAAEVVGETLQVTVSERGATRMDDRTSEASMERRKKEGYF